MDPWYALLAGAGFVVAGILRRREVARLGYDRDPRHAWGGVGGRAGAMIGSKLLMAMWEPPSSLLDTLAS